MSLDYCTKQKSFYFTDDELLAVQESAIPEHVAIIMDGNRRWAKKKHGLSRIAHVFDGHSSGAETLLRIVEASVEIGLKVLTVFGFSTENRNRSLAEVEVLNQIIETNLKKNRSRMVEHGVRFHAIGNIASFSQELQTEIMLTEKETQQGNKIDLVIALNYGGRDDLRRAMIAISKDFSSGKLTQTDITEALITSYLDTAKWKDPDLVIRTSGEKRVSNFLLWQLAYSELFVTDVLWPDFTPHDLLAAIFDFQRRERRLGV